MSHAQGTKKKRCKRHRGKVREGTEKLVGSKEQRIKGLGRQISGKAEKYIGDCKEVVKGVIKDANKHS